MALAEENLRKKGLSKMDGRVDRESSDGRVAVAMNDDASKCAIVEVNTETDFTAKNDTFLAMVEDVAQRALQQPAGDVQKTDEMQVRIDDLRVTTKENVAWRRGRVFDGGKIGYYVHHDGKTGVVVQVDGEIDQDTLRKICLHVASHDPAPIAVTPDDVPAEILAKEREIAKAQAMASGKPENIAEKMVDGKIAKYLDGVVLLRQSLVMDAEKKIKDLLPPGTAVTGFVKYRVGE